MLQVTNEAFAYLAEDTEGFNLVDTQKALPQVSSSAHLLDHQPASAHDAPCERQSPRTPYLAQAGWDRGMRGRGRGRFGGRARGTGRWAAAPMGAEARFNAKFNAKKAPQAPVSKWKKNQV